MKTQDFGPVEFCGLSNGFTVVVVVAIVNLQRA